MLQDLNKFDFLSFCLQISFAHPINPRSFGSLIGQNCFKGRSNPILPTKEMPQVLEPVFRLCQSFSGETSLCLTDVI